MLIQPSAHGHLGCFYLLAIVSLLRTWGWESLLETLLSVLLGTPQRWDRWTPRSFHVNSEGPPRRRHRARGSSPSASPAPPSRPWKQPPPWATVTGPWQVAAGAAPVPSLTTLAGPPACLAAVLGERVLAHTWSRPGHTECPCTGGSASSSPPWFLARSTGPRRHHEQPPPHPLPRLQKAALGTPPADLPTRCFSFIFEMILFSRRLEAASVWELYVGAPLSHSDVSPAPGTSRWEGAEGSVEQGGQSPGEGALSLGGGQSPPSPGGRWALCKAISAAWSPAFLDTKLYNEPSRNQSWKKPTPECERCICRQKIKPAFPKARCLPFSGQWPTV